MDVPKYLNTPSIIEFANSKNVQIKQGVKNGAEN